jgi:hypothetical protein
MAGLGEVGGLAVGDWLGLLRVRVQVVGFLDFFLHLMMLRIKIMREHGGNLRIELFPISFFKV